MPSARTRSISSERIDKYWAMSLPQLLALLLTTNEGLTSSEAYKRRIELGENRIESKGRQGALWLLLGQLKSPITMLLLVSVVLSFFLHDATDAAIILLIIAVSSLLGFWQEYSAADTLEKLLAVIKTTSTILRDSKETLVAVEEVVPGDIVMISAGDKIPADCRILEAKDLFVNEASLTGETFPVEKNAAPVGLECGLGQRVNSLFLGTFAVSGTARALVVHTGQQTEFSSISERLRLRPAETDFERGVRQFGGLLVEVTIVLVIAVFAINVYFDRPVLEAFMFSLALAVGLTPQLLPAVISVNLAHGAKKMAEQQVIIRKLPSIENFGSMDILCSDKTGTLTEGEVQIHTACDARGSPSEKVLFYSYLNAVLQSGFHNPIDEAIRKHRQFDLQRYSKQDEVPYDFIRKRLSITVAHDGQQTMITKGALENVLAICRDAEVDGHIVPLSESKETVLRFFSEQSKRGMRCLGVAFRNVADHVALTRDEERDMTFLGFIVLFDPPKADIVETVADLKSLGVLLKIVTGDNRFVAQEVARHVLQVEPRVLTGDQIRVLSEEALIRQSTSVEVFAEVEPNQKERIVLALKKAGHVTGYMGDGINDASALHAADVGISVDSAVDVAKEAADIILMKRDLKVLASGISRGRKTFANTLKYVFMATSANFGNMFSMAGVSLFLPFLPLLPKQILLINLLTDFPEMTIATDSVDKELIAAPQRWNVKLIRNFMLVFGTLSSIFDFLTFGLLVILLHADVRQFRTGWFIESVISAAAVVLIIRSRRRLGESRPSNMLLVSTSSIVIATVALPYTAIGAIMGLTPVPITVVMGIAFIILLYILCAEVVKRFFFGLR